MKFEKTTYDDLGKINKLSPEGWGDITPQIENYLKLDFCDPVKLTHNNEIIGIGTAIYYKNTSWIAHLIVNEKYRRKGYGTEILEHLCNKCKMLGFRTILLFASDLGYPIYEKFGFKIQTEYIQYRKTNPDEYKPNLHIRKIETEDHEKILQLDKSATGEDRQNILACYINDGYVYSKDGSIQGFYLQNPGEKAIIAGNEEAGLELLKYRISENDYATIPIDNKCGNEFYIKHNFRVFRKIKRMIYGNEINCKSEKIFNRIGGNFG